MALLAQLILHNCHIIHPTQCTHGKNGGKMSFWNITGCPQAEFPYHFSSRQVESTVEAPH